MATDKVEISRRELIAVLKDLEMIVVSLDHLGSAAGNLGDQEYYRASAAFLDEWHVTQRLAKARSVLAAPFSREVGPDGMDELERELQDVDHWTVSRQTPSDH